MNGASLDAATAGDRTFRAKRSSRLSHLVYLTDPGGAERREHLVAAEPSAGRRTHEDAALYGIPTVVPWTRVGRYLATGNALRLRHGEEFRRSQLLRDGPAGPELAPGWRSRVQGLRMDLSG